MYVNILIRQIMDKTKCDKKLALINLKTLIHMHY